MKKLFYTANLFLIIASIIFLFPQKIVLADGMMIKPDPYSDRWDYFSESNQQAFINFDNGLEKMIISIGLEKGGTEGAVWLFPVPASPEKVAIDVVNQLPVLYGQEITGKAKYKLDDSAKFLQATQIYTIPFVFYSEKPGMPGSGIVNSMGTKQGSEDKSTESDVMVYEQLEKEGITSEIVTAKTANGLYDYLQNKGLKIEAGSISVLDNYIGKDYSFVASWVSSPEKSTYGQKGVFVTFFTKEIYFPLLPTSVYGSKVVPATIRVLGYVSPKIFDSITSYTKIGYYNYSAYTNFTNGLENFYGNQSKNIKYTKIEINAPSKFLVQDLWINNYAPVKTYYSNFVAEHSVVSAIILFILSSIIAGVLAGFIIFKDLRKRPIKLGLIGLSNCLTIIGIIMTTVLIGTKNGNEDAGNFIAEIKQEGYIWRRKTAVILFFIALPFLIIGLFVLLPLISELKSAILDSYYNGFVSTFLIPALIFYIFPIIAMLVCLIMKNIEPKDKDLFKQLKLYNYSSWSFKPKDKLKFAFVPLFSVTFLAVSWLLVRIIEFTV